MERTRDPELEEFREKVRDWLASNVPSRPRPDEGLGSRAYDLEWQQIQFKGGWAGISWPREYGGQGLSLGQQLVWYEECARADAPSPGACFVGLNHAGPTLVQRADDAQKKYHLPRILRGEVIWCQGFSEPNAGSDLGSVRTKAVIDGNHLVVNGQKIWTSHAHLADYQELLVRTDSTAPKHKGISWVICDMKSPGVSVRPIRTMSGHTHFCEVFYDNVRIPLENVVGQLNDGWSVAMSTLGFERGTSFILEQMKLAGALDRVIAMLSAAPSRRRTHGKLVADDDVVVGLADLRSDIDALRAMTYANVARMQRRGAPGPEGSMIRLYFSETAKKLYRFASDMLGTAALERSQDTADMPWEYLNSFRLSIAAGTSEIQRNIIGERLLGLPRPARG